MRVMAAAREMWANGWGVALLARVSLVVLFMQVRVCAHFWASIKAAWARAQVYLHLSVSSIYIHLSTKCFPSYDVKD